MRVGWLMLITIATIAGGCAPRARMMVWRPAQLDVSGIGRLAVVDFQGSDGTGSIARDVVLAHLSENRHYTLVDQTELARAQPAAFAQASFSEAAALEAARQSGVDAILTGQVVSYNVADQFQHDQHFSIAGAGGAGSGGVKVGGIGIGFDNNSLHSRDASVSLAFKLIDARTGEIRDAQQTSHSFSGRVVNGEGDMLGRERILNDLLRQCSRDVVAAIAPHQVNSEVILARQYWGNGLSELRRGNALAKKGDWNGAEGAWRGALERNPQNHAAHHNLALACEARGDYAAARQHLDRALQHFAATLYHQTGDRLRAEERDHTAAMAQMAARPRMLAPANSLAPMAPPTNVLPSSIILPTTLQDPIDQPLQRLPPPDPLP